MGGNDCGIGSGRVAFGLRAAKLIFAPNPTKLADNRLLPARSVVLGLTGLALSLIVTVFAGADAGGGGGGGGGGCGMNGEVNLRIGVV